MKKIYSGPILLLILFTLIITSCADSDFESTTYPTTAYSAEGGALISVNNVVNGFYDKVVPATSFVEFTIDEATLGLGSEAVSSMDIQYSYNGGAYVTLQSVSSLPATISAPFPTILAGAGVAESAVEVGDNVLFEFNNIQTASGTFGTGTSLNVPVSCASSLGGTFDFVSTNLVAANSGTDCPTDPVTGTVTFDDQGGGTYLISDLGFGQYESTCWNDGPATSGGATITDVCGAITSGGTDQYGLVYVWVITDVSGPDLSISWTNNYADSGNTVVTRPDGSDWPPIFTE